MNNSAHTPRSQRLPGRRRPGVDVLHLSFGFVPVPAVFDFAAHAPLVFFEPVFMLLEAAQRQGEAGVAHGGESRYSHVDADGAGGRWNGLLTSRSGKPFASRLADGDVFGRAQNARLLR